MFPHKRLVDFGRHLEADDREAVLWLFDRPASDDTPEGFANGLCPSTGEPGIPLPVLLEAVFLVGRLDLVSTFFLLDVGFIIERLRSSPSYFSPYKHLMLSIDRQLSERDVKNLVFLTGDQLGRRRNQSPTFFRWLSQMEKAALVSPSNYMVLSDLLQAVSRRDVAKVVAANAPG
ncbi:FLIP [Macaca mulatta rhadinovirus 17577]|uniref:FLIP n=1 Tax=Macaca mulatta rhadinovirus 17577 TaxID=83534 RepID=Q9WRM4_9GAMA|nr:FLIP [Macacine gammaherpesvirus 5]AAD21404.1 FLIP [Macaca mulatta rhadinovirus 17577]